jgi:hypothetical protein
VCFSRNVDEKIHLFDLSLHLSRWALWKWRMWTRRILDRPASAVVPYIVDTDAFAPADDVTRRHSRHRLGIFEDAFVFGRIGQPIESKWSPLLFTAFTQLARERPEVLLLVAGLPDSFQRHVASLPAEIGRRIVTIPLSG